MLEVADARSLSQRLVDARSVHQLAGFKEVNVGMPTVSG
jgi:hypothetical protein